MRILTRFCGTVVLALAALVLAQAQVGANSAELELFAAVNQARRAQGLPALRWNESLAAAARKHAALMAQHGDAEHGFAGEPNLAARVTQAGARFAFLSENVVQGTTARTIHAEFMRSPNHRANMLDSDMDSIGVGVVRRGEQLFAVEDFCKAR
jgi:uncharacterized protein YkwD